MEGGRKEEGKKIERDTGKGMTSSELSNSLQTIGSVMGDWQLVRRHKYQREEMRPR